MPKITKSLIDKTEPGAKDVFLWDDEVKGFGVRIQPTGSKAYIVRYRNEDGVQRKQKLGRTTDFDPGKARELARKVFTKVAEGKDPLEERRADKVSPTVADMRERYKKEHAMPFKKQASQNIDEQNWRLHIIPELGERRVSEITKADVVKLFGSLSEKPATGNQCVALLSKAMNLAEDWGWRKSNTNPCHRIKRYKLKKRDLILTYEQMRRLHTTMITMVDERRLEPAFASFIRLLQLTGCRKNEILQSEAAWIDREKRVLRLPDSKVGPRDIPLSDAALAIVDDLEGKFLIQGREGKHTQNVYRVWARVKKEAGLPAALRLHDLRHSAGSLAHMAGMTQSQIAELLGHSVLATTEKYIHNHDGDAAKAANVLGAVITASWTELAPA
jgi:integrase